MRAVWIAVLVALTPTLAACKKPPEQPAPVPPISMAEPPRLTDRPPAAAAPRPARVPAQAPDPNLVLAQSARAALQQAFGTQGAPLLNVAVADGVVTVTAQPGSSATQAQVRAALATLPGAPRVDAPTLPP